MLAYPPLRFQFFWLFFYWNLNRTCAPLSATSATPLFSGDLSLFCSKRELLDISHRNQLRV
jgi:hypothetical protein